jgi:translation initiation factor IF-3
VRLIDEEGQQLGIVPTAQALAIARERGLDLVEVAPNAIPPVCRIMDYGKARYEQSRKERESRKNAKTITIKEVRIEPRIDEHDLETKGKRAKTFLEEGDKVKLTVMFRGRSILHPELGRALLDRLIEQLAPYGVVEAIPRLEGRNMTAMLAPKKQPAPAASGAGRDGQRGTGQRDSREPREARPAPETAEPQERPA